jgi:hypothetical protein
LIAKDRTSNKNIEEISLYDTAKLNKNRVWLRAFFRNLLGDLPYSVSTGKYDGGSRKNCDIGYFEGIAVKARGFCLKSKAASKLVARWSV